MKFVQIVTQMEGGGAQRAAVLLSQELLKNEHSSEVWFLYVKRPLYSSLPFVRSLLSHPPKSIFDYITLMIKIIILLVKEHPDVLITHTHYANILCQPIAALLNIKIRCAVQHSLLETYPKLAKALDYILGSLGFYTTNIVVSKSVLHNYKHHPKRYQNKLKMIYNGVSLTSPNLTRHEVRDELHIPNNNTILVNVGRLAEVKNQRLLIRITSKLPDCNLILVGDGELKSELEQYANQAGCIERVHFLGESSSQTISNVLNASDIFLFPSLSESMGLALIEAMKCELPIIASDIPAVREVLEIRNDDYAGIILPPNDESKFIEAIKELINNKKLSRYLGENASLKATIYSLANMTKQYERIALLRLSEVS